MIKKINQAFFVTVLIFPVLSSTMQAEQLNKSIIELQFFKNSDWSLKEDFLKNLASLSGASIFIESGTYAGATVNNAIPWFKEIHTIELSQMLYSKAVERFKREKNVFLYNGDSAIVLSEILSNIKGKAIFWLDGHYSGGATARGNTDTPILQELQAINKSGLKKSLILIDDVRCFEMLPDYPSLGEVYKAIEDIDPSYHIEIMGDVLIAYCDDELFDLSPVIKACTVSRFSDYFYTSDDVS